MNVANCVNTLAISNFAINEAKKGCDVGRGQSLVGVYLEDG